MSSNVEDRRGERASGSSGASLLGLIPMVFRFLGFKGTAVVVLLIGAYGLLSGDLGNMLALLGIGQPPPNSRTFESIQETPEEKELVNFVSVILADTEETWTALFQQGGRTYQEPRLVLFRDAVDSACGMAQSAVGPFYCPADQRVYIDLGFYEELKNRFKAPGDFAQAYVIAHEIGHHVQNLLGVSSKVQAARSRMSQVDGNRLSVLLELQADCLAGVWANHANRERNLLEMGDVEEGLQAASAIGDDTLQRQARGYVSPDSFTHGSSAQRVKWFRIGLENGVVGSCDTFK